MNRNDKIIEIIYTCTGGYVNYTKPFLESIKYFFPNNRKFVRIISDGAEEYAGFHDNNVIYTEVIKKPNLIYPCVPIHKMYWINEIPRMAADYTFYFDADTIFKEVPYYNWDEILDRLDEGCVMISKNPYYLHPDDGVRNYWVNTTIMDNTEKDETQGAYIDSDTPYTYVITSFFGGNSYEMHRICDKIVEMQLGDMTRDNWYHIPKFIDENYFNRLVYDAEKGRGNGEFTFLVRHFNEFYGLDNIQRDSVFMYQKNMKDYKFNRR